MNDRFEEAARKELQDKKWDFDYNDVEIAERLTAFGRAQWDAAIEAAQKAQKTQCPGCKLEYDIRALKVKE